MTRSATPPKRRRSVSSAPASPLLDPRDVRAYLLDHASRIALADLDSLVGRASEVRAKAKHDDAGHALFHRQLDVALQLLEDHVAGQCPQIPLHTVCLLAAALFYWLEPIDFIPDFIPGGTIDDALVLELAYELGAAGIERYCTFKGIAGNELLPKATPRR